MADQSPIVCDSGTGYMKIGWADQNFPSLSIPAMVGRPMLRFGEKVGTIELKDVMIGDEAEGLRSYLELSHPVQEGIVNDWDDMTLLWDYSFKKMNAQTKDATIMMTEAAMNPVKNREKMAEILFEKFQFGKMQVGIQALLSLFAEGLMTSLLTDTGDGVTHCIPVVDGALQKSCIKRMNIAGRHITSYLVKLLFLKGYAFNSTADFELVREIKERACFVSHDIMIDRRMVKETTALMKEYKLPDGQIVKIDRERFEAAELMFNPSLDGNDFDGLSEMVFDSINKSPLDTRKSLYQNIMISGGTSMFPGFPTRLQNDIKKLYKKNIAEQIKFDIEIIDPPRRKYNVFIGGGVLAKAMQNANNFWISKQEYEEQGKSCVKKIGDSLSI